MYYRDIHRKILGLIMQCITSTVYNNQDLLTDAIKTYMSTINNPFIEESNSVGVNQDIHSFGGTFTHGNSNILWSYLVKKYELDRFDNFTHINIFKSLLNCRFELKHDPHTYISKIKNHINRLNRLAQHPKYRVEPGETLSNQFKIAIATCGLNDHYYNIIKQN